MAVTSNELIQNTFREMFVHHLEPRLLATTLCNRKFEGDVANAYEVKIVTPTVVVAKTSVSVIHPTYPVSPGTVDVGDQTMALDQAGQYSVNIPYEDVRALPSGLLEDAAGRMSRVVAEAYDANIFAAMTAGVKSANTRAVVGTSANYIPKTSDGPAGTGADLVWDELKRLELQLQLDNIHATGSQEREVWVVMHPTLWNAVLVKLEAQKYSEFLTANVITGGIHAGVPGFQGKLRNLNILINTQVPDGSTSGKTEQVMLAGTNAATTFAARPPLQGTEGPAVRSVGASGAMLPVGHFIWQDHRWGRRVVDNQFLYKASFRSEA